MASTLAEAGKAADAPLTWAILQRRWPDIDDALVEKWVDYLMHMKSLKLQPATERKRKAERLPAKFYDHIEKILFPAKVRRGLGA